MTSPSHTSGELILGIWDGHDSGAALVRGQEILFAVNEERLSRRKLEIQFPSRSLRLILERTGIPASSIRQVAVSTTDFAKTLTRLFPSMKEEYYLIRRRKKRPGGLNGLKKRVKYTLTEWPPTRLSRELTARAVRKELEPLGLGDCHLELVDHHWSHAIAAAACCPFKDATVITIDGIGDALSGSVNLLHNNELTQESTISGKESLGIFFEHVTNLMNMRELEDEGKVMALASYAHPVPDEANPMLEWFHVSGLTLHARYGSQRMFQQLKRLLWQYPSEQFAYMAQRTLEVKILELVQKAVSEFHCSNVALAGGLFANILINRVIRLLPEVEGCFTFPHMGDGGLALGAAMALNMTRNHVLKYPFRDVYLGPEDSEAEMVEALEEFGFPYRRSERIAGEAAELLVAGKIGLWHQGRMEYGPRALGARSIIAAPGSEQIKNALNLRLKRRVWYQPFCPSMLERTAQAVLEDFNGQADPFMTNAYRVRETCRDRLRGVIHIDGTCRPQIISPDSPLPPNYRELLEEIEQRTGLGVLLNTSFNLHGEPLVCSPRDSLRTFKETGADYLVLGDYLVEQPQHP